MNDADDGELQLKKRARRRLVGAIAFAAFAALALPLVMNHEPPPPAQDVEYRIPGQNDATLAPLQPEVALIPVPVPVPAEPAALPEPVAPTPQTQVPAATPTVTVTQTTPQPTQATQPTTAPRAEAKPAAPKVEPRPEAKPAPKPETPKPTPAEIEAQRAAAILAGRLPDAVTTAPTTSKPAVVATAPTVPKPAATPAIPHVVQIGAFADAAKVQNLKQKLTELRIPVYTEALDSPQGKITRVRAGPFVSREAAEQALGKIQGAGVSGSVVPQ